LGQILAQASWRQILKFALLAFKFRDLCRADPNIVIAKFYGAVKIPCSTIHGAQRNLKSRGAI